MWGFPSPNSKKLFSACLRCALGFVTYVLISMLPHRANVGFFFFFASFPRCHKRAFLRLYFSPHYSFQYWANLRKVVVSFVRLPGMFLAFECACVSSSRVDLPFPCGSPGVGRVSHRLCLDIWTPRRGFPFTELSSSFYLHQNHYPS